MLLYKHSFINYTIERLILWNIFLIFYYEYSFFVYSKDQNYFLYPYVSIFKIKPYSISTNIVLLLYCIASAKWFMVTDSCHWMSAMVRASLMVRWTTLVDKVNFLDASARKSLQPWSRGISSSICFDVICALDMIESQINLCCWIFQALTTLSLILAEFSSAILFKILSIFSLGISRIISILSNNGHEILLW